MSFTATQHDPAFFDVVRDFTGSVPRGLTAFADSAWLMSIVLPHQPHFIDQPSNINVFWGYGLNVNRPLRLHRQADVGLLRTRGDDYLLGHLRIGSEAPRMLDATIVIPCMMPFITSQFLRRAKGGRPSVLPDGWRNLGFIGQFVKRCSVAIGCPRQSIGDRSLHPSC